MALARHVSGPSADRCLPGPPLRCGCSSSANPARPSELLARPPICPPAGPRQEASLRGEWVEAGEGIAPGDPAAGVCKDAGPSHRRPLPPAGIPGGNAPGAGRVAGKGAVTREGRGLGVSGRAQWSKSRAAGGEAEAAGALAGGGEARREQGGKERVSSAQGVAQRQGAPGLRPRGLLALLWTSEGAGKTWKARGWGQLDRDLRTGPVGRVWLRSKTVDTKSQTLQPLKEWPECVIGGGLSARTYLDRCPHLRPSWTLLACNGGCQRGSRPCLGAEAPPFFPGYPHPV